MSEQMKVYLVETVDDLLENWFPTSVYLHRESAENCAEALRCDDGYIRQFARVVEMKVADTEACQTDADGLDSGHVRNSSAYEAGYRDGSIHYELEHCPACKNIADLQEALDENAKLIVKLNAEHIVRQNVEVENAKLRELCEDMLDCIEIRVAFGRPPTGEMYERFADAARELGIEVDG